MIGAAAALLPLTLAAGCSRTDARTESGGSLERIEAWQAVERYRIDQRMHQTSVGEWLRTPGNEGGSVEDAEAALGLTPLDPVPAVEAALSIALADPVDDLGFLALHFAFYEHRSLEGQERLEAQDAVYDLLEAHYIDDPRLDLLLLGLIRFGGERGVRFVDAVVARSDQRHLRARGAFWSAMERLMLVDDLESSPEERARVRAEVARMAELVAEEYAEVEVFRGEAGGEAIQPVLYALENLAIGSILPDAVADRIGGGRERLAEYRGSVLLLDFWATWCAPCIASFPDVERLQRLLAELDFQVITISIDDDVELVHRFTSDRMELPYVNWFVGAESELYDDWAIQGVPTYIAVDRDGIVLGRSHEVEPLYDVILEAAGAGEEVRAALSESEEGPGGS